MKNPIPLTLQKYSLSPKLLILLVVLAGLGGAWKMVHTLAAAARPDGAASPPYVYQVKDINPQGSRYWAGSAAAGDTLYFGTTSLYPNGNFLWKSDGAAAGTVKVKNENVTSNYTAAGEGLFYTGWDPDTDFTMLSYSDGTEAGTTALISWYPGDCFPEELVYVNGIMFLHCNTTGHDEEP